MINQQPVLLNVGIIGGLTSQGVGILLDYLNVSGDRAATLQGFIVGVILLIISLITRQQVTPYDPAVDNTVASTGILRVLETQVNQGTAVLGGVARTVRKTTRKSAR